MQGIRERGDLPESLVSLFELVARETEERTGWQLTNGGTLEIRFNRDGRFTSAYGHGELRAGDPRLNAE